MEKSLYENYQLMIEEIITISKRYNGYKYICCSPYNYSVSVVYSKIGATIDIPHIQRDGCINYTLCKQKCKTITYIPKLFPTIIYDKINNECYILTKPLINDNIVYNKALTKLNLENSIEELTKMFQTNKDLMNVLKNEQISKRKGT